MIKALEPEKKVYSKDEAEEIVKHLLYMNRVAVKEDEDRLIRKWNWISPKFTTAANLRPTELRSTKSDPSNAEDFTKDEVAWNVSLGVACLECTNETMKEYKPPNGRDIWNLKIPYCQSTQHKPNLPALIPTTSILIKSSAIENIMTKTNSYGLNQVTKRPKWRCQ